MIRNVLVAIGVAAVVAPTAHAQSTFNPSFSAPYRAFSNKEFGVTVSFPGRADAALEGVYRVGTGNFDVGFRGGVALGAGRANDDLIIFGTELRQRIISHTQDFPFDGALVAGVGARIGDVNQIVIPGGLSLGRRLDVRDSDVSIVPFLQPTIMVIAGDADEVDFSMGFGADFRLTPSFDLRISGGLGNPDGISLSAVWVR